MTEPTSRVGRAAAAFLLGAFSTGIALQFPGQRDFSFAASFNRSDAPGNTALRVVALGASGQGGLQTNAPICIESRVPDNGHACEPTKPVPAAVFSLTWDTAFDVD